MAGTRKAPKFVPRLLDDLTPRELADELAKLPQPVLVQLARQVGISTEHPPREPEAKPGPIV